MNVSFHGSRTRGLDFLMCEACGINSTRSSLAQCALLRSFTLFKNIKLLVFNPLRTLAHIYPGWGWGWGAKSEKAPADSGRSAREGSGPSGALAAGRPLGDNASASDSQYAG